MKKFLKSCRRRSSLDNKQLCKKKFVLYHWNCKMLKIVCITCTFEFTFHWIYCCKNTLIWTFFLYFWVRFLLQTPQQHQHLQDQHSCWLHFILFHFSLLVFIFLCACFFMFKKQLRFLAFFLLFSLQIKCGNVGNFFLRWRRREENEKKMEFYISFDSLFQTHNSRFFTWEKDFFFVLHLHNLHLTENSWNFKLKSSRVCFAMT